MAYNLVREQVVERPLEETFAFFAEPRNLAKITPRWLGFSIVELDPGPMREGYRMRYRIHPLGFPSRWTSKITAWDPPHRFVDEQVEGPYRFWRHEHTFRAVDGGTEIRDRVEYALPLGALGRIAHSLLVKWQLQAIFRYRERKVRRILG